MHPGPKRVGIVGLGSGVTAGAALTHPIAELEVVEISPEVVEASRWFDAYNGRPLADDRTRLIVGDARTHFALRSAALGRYDVIVSEPSNPWMAGVAALFTREFFEAARAQLATSGIMCQWAHTYDISDADLRSIVATFRGVFADTTLWLVGDADLLLIGKIEAPGDPATAINAGFQRSSAAADVATVGVNSAFAVLSLFAGDAEAAAAYAGSAPIETDDRLRLEFSGPRSLIGRALSDNAEALRALNRAGALPRSIAAVLDRAAPADWTSRGTMLLDASPGLAYVDFNKAIAGGDDGALAGLRKAAMASGRVADAVTLIKSVANDRRSSPVPLIELSRLLAATGDLPGALAAARAAVERFPQDPGAYQQLAGVLADAGETAGVAEALDRLRALDPSGPETRYYSGVIAFMRGDLRRAVEEGEAALSLDARHARAHNLVGAARASLGDVSGAEKAFAAAIAVDPRDPSPYVNLGQLRMQRGQADAAIASFSEALAVQPSLPSAREGLASAFELRGQADRAARVRAVERAGPVPHRR
jgi:spermidine synthase